MENLGKSADETDVRQTTEDAAADQMTVDQWLAIRKEAGLQIDPETAEVDWWYAQTLDPYGVYPDLPDEYHQVGREYFACSPGSDVWVNFGDLPDTTRDALWGKHRSKLAFPAGLPDIGPEAPRAAQPGENVCAICGLFAQCGYGEKPDWYCNDHRPEVVAWRRFVEDNTGGSATKELETFERLDREQKGP